MKREETIDHNIKASWHAIARMYNQQAMKYGGTMSIGFALLNINAEEGTPATKIAPLMGLEARSLTRLLNTMEEKGLIYRVADKLDKRCTRIMLTGKGRGTREKSKETVLRFNEVVRELVPDKKLDIFFEVLRNIKQIIEKNNIYETINV